MKRRTFLGIALTIPPLSTALGRAVADSSAALSTATVTAEGKIMTVRGPITTASLGVTLIHEHVLVDFSGFQQYNPTRWNDDAVITKMLPYLQEAKEAGCTAMIECTPNYLGRDPELLRRLSEKTGLHLITNTGYYGGSDNKYLPPAAFSETSHQLAARWVAEATDGLDGTGVYPGFIKISVNPGVLSDVSRKLVEAAAHTHLQTGLTIASHTGPAIPAFEEIELLRQRGVAPAAFIWVHAQGADSADHVRAARLGAWVSLDGLADDNLDAYVTQLDALRRKDLLSRTLVSHDAGWYDPAKPDGGNIRGYTTLFKTLVPRLKGAGFSSDDIHQLMVVNPAAAFEIRVRII